MPELTRLLIEGLGETARQMICPINAGLLPVSSENLEHIVAALINSSNRDCVKGLVRMREAIGEKRRDYQGNGTTMLAVRNLGHDFDNVITPIYMIVSSSRLIELMKKNPHTLMTKITSALISQANSRLISLAAAYIASEGKQDEYITSVPVDYLPNLLRQSANGKELVVLQGSVDEIPSTSYIAAYQAVKNSRGRRIFVSSERLKLKEKEYVFILVEDEGPGLIHESGEAFAYDEISAIFYGKTTKPKKLISEDIGGIGLQVARKLVELSKGNIEVITKTSTGHLYYSLFPETGITAYREPLTTPTGTRFIISIPLEKHCIKR